MQQESGAKIVLRGRGSVKDGRAQRAGPSDPSDNEDLHVLITADTEESLNKVCTQEPGRLCWFLHMTTLCLHDRGSLGAHCVCLPDASDCSHGICGHGTCSISLLLQATGMVEALLRPQEDASNAHKQQQLRELAELNGAWPSPGALTRPLSCRFCSQAARLRLFAHSSSQPQALAAAQPLGPPAMR